MNQLNKCNNVGAMTMCNFKNSEGEGHIHGNRTHPILEVVYHNHIFPSVAHG